MNTEYWAGRRILITGGTGSFGRAFLYKVMPYIDRIKEIRIFSRDEKKQDDMRRQFDHPKIKFIIGDVRDKETVDTAMIGVDFVFHAAALKHVSSGENYPYETVKTNVIGSHNVIESAIQHNVTKVVVLSTDKAVNPTCAMGMAKGLMEKCALARCMDSDTQICVTRFGNVMGSRNSVIPIFAELLAEDKPVSITDPEMKRYMMTMDQAQELVLYAFESAKTGDILTLNAPMASVRTIYLAVKRIVSPTSDVNAMMKIVGPGRGEKKVERLLTDEEWSCARSFDMPFGNVFLVPHERVTLPYSTYSTKELDFIELEKLILHAGILEGVVF